MRRFLLSSLFLAASACSGPTGPSDSSRPPPLLDALPRQLSPEEQVLIDAGNQFTFDLFREATQGLPADSNALLSPLSASMALGMVLNGAGGTTFDSIRVALRVAGYPIDQINTGYLTLTDLLTTLDPSTEIAIANSVWGHTGFPIKPTFLEAVRTWFAGEAQEVDFGDPATVGMINDWVKTKTRDRIPKLLERIDPGEVAFLINAIYFKGQWREAFDRSKTRDGPFYGADATRSVPMMSRTGALNATATGDYQAAELLYGNGAYAMTIILPGEGLSPQDILQGLTPASWRSLTQSLTPSTIPFMLPRFRFDYSKELKTPLSDMGMRIAFDEGRADLSGIADVGPERLYITRVTQKAFIEVNEEGTEAAAATSVGIGVTSAPTPMIVDRPFLFAIRERLTGTVLFLGQVNTLK